MGKNLEIPSEFLRVTAGPYKGQYAWYRDRIMRGRIVSIILTSSGSNINLPIQCVVFIDTNNGEEYQYSMIENDGNRGYVLNKLSTNNDIIMNEESTIIPVISKNRRSSELFLPDPEDVHIEEDDEDTWKVELFEKGEDYKKISEEITETKAKYGDVYDVLKEKKIANVLLDKIVMIFSVLGLEPDYPASVEHFNILNGVLKDKMFSEEIIDDKTKSLLAMAYAFIHINNLNIGYPVILQGCKVSSNDDPSYIVCAAVRTGFIKDFDQNIQIKFINFIKMISKILKTEVIPSVNHDIINLTKKTSLMYIQQTPAQRTKKPKLMRFPLPDKHIIKEKSLAPVIKKVNGRILVEKNKQVKEILKRFSKNPDFYTKGEGYLKISKYPGNPESIILSPYISEYKKKAAIQEEKFYENPRSSIVVNQKKLLEDSLKLELKNAMIEDLNSTTDKEDLYIKKYLLDNLDDIVSLSSSDIKLLESGMETETTREYKKIEATISLNKRFKQVLAQQK